jgi:hypothetical protein
MEAEMQNSKPVEVHKIPMSPDNEDSAMMMKHRKKGQQKRLDESEEQGFVILFTKIVINSSTQFSDVVPPA